jgi:GDP-mannose 6-dehydrogenase
MKVSIFGLGYVGAVSLACLSRDGHEVIGVDIDAAKLDLIMAGKTPVVEEGMVDLMALAAASGRVAVTTDAQRAVLDSEISLVCVGTPSAANGSQDQGAILRLAERWVALLPARARRTSLSSARRWCRVRSRKYCVRSSKRSRERRTARVFFSASSPSFCAKARRSAITTSRPLPSSVPITPFRPSGCAQLFGKLPCRFIETSVRSAEMMKYCCNNFHALKITFANETARLCDALGVDAFEVMDLVCQDTQLNISSAYLRPGFAFGGSCLPKDLRATTYLAKIHDVEVPMLGGIMQSNRHHLDLALRKLLALGKRKIGFIGLSFKTGTDDLRESPLVTLAEQLIGKGMQLAIYDPEVHLASLLGANRSFIEKHLPHIGQMMRSEIEEVVTESEVLVIGLSGREVADRLASLCRPEQVLLDLVRLPDPAAIPARVEGLCW